MIHIFTRELQMMMLNEDGSREGMEHNLKTILGSPFFES